MFISIKDYRTLNRALDRCYIHEEHDSVAYIAHSIRITPCR